MEAGLGDWPRGFMNELHELQLREKWLTEYFEARHKTWPLRNDADLTPAGKSYCKDQMRILIRKTIAEIRGLRQNA